MSKDDKNKVNTTGHQWDGIEEYNNPLPRWWVWIFYACIVWGIGYSIAYPAWPLVKGATPGLLGFSTRANVAADIEKFKEKTFEVFLPQQFDGQVFAVCAAALIAAGVVFAVDYWIKRVRA